MMILGELLKRNIFYEQSLEIATFSDQLCLILIETSIISS